MMRTLIYCGLLLTAMVASAPAWAQPGIVLTPKTAHPDVAVTFTGSGFGDLEAVDVYVDTTDTLLLVSGATGTLSGSVTIPIAAQPGTHYVTAIGRRTGDAAQAEFTVSTAWNELGFGAARLGQNPWENTLNTSSVATLGPLWEVPAGTDSSAVIAGGRVLVASANGLGIQALSVLNGALKWSALTTAVFDTTPAISGTQLYVGSLEGAIEGTMYALNATTGAVAWSTPIGSNIESSPVVVGNTVYVGCDNGNVYAFAATTSGQTAGGSILWTYATGGAVISSPAVVNNVVYEGSGDANIYALNAASGSLIWKYATSGPVYGNPAVAGGVVYVGSADGYLYAIKAATGGLVWRENTGAAITSSPAYAEGTVYIGNDSGELLAYNAHTGALQWSVNFPNAFNLGGPSVANGVVYAAAEEGTLYALDAATGALLWTGATGSAGYTYPSISDGVVYFSSGDGNLYAYAPQAGTSVVQRPAISALHPDLSLPVTEFR